MKFISRPEQEEHKQDLYSETDFQFSQQNEQSNLLAKEQRIRGISIARNAERGVFAIKEAILEFEKEYNLNFLVPLIDFNTKYIGKGYGEGNWAIQNTIRKMLLQYQLPLDPTYTGKAFCGITQEMKTSEGKKILFIHTGGTPLFYGYLEKMLKD